MQIKKNEIEEIEEIKRDNRVARMLWFILGFIFSYFITHLF